MAQVVRRHVWEALKRQSRGAGREGKRGAGSWCLRVQQVHGLAGARPSWIRSASATVSGAGSSPSPSFSLRLQVW